MIVDASGQILGRLSSNIAGKLLDGEEVTVVNAGKSIITGSPDEVVERYSKKVKSGDPHHGPYHPKKSDKIFRRSIRGMLPMDKSRGDKAFKRLDVYAGNPNGEDGEKLSKGKEDITTNYITLEELSNKLGG